jgi:CRISPR/Cas system CMR-associated protein Cmr5 small subunit
MGMINVRIVNGFHNVLAFVKMKHPATQKAVSRAIRKHACKQSDCHCTTYVMLESNDILPDAIARWDDRTEKWDYEWKWGDW